MTTGLRLVMIATCVASFGWTAACAEDFCIHTKVHLGKEAVESVTMFRGGVVYDFIDSPEEITILDPPRDRFVVLDVTRKVKVAVTEVTIKAFSEKLRQEAQARKVDLLVFLADPKFDETYDESSGELSMTSPWMSYKVKTAEPKFPVATAQYAAYSDAQTQLNTLLKPGSLPPFARMALNSALADRGRLPTEVQLTRYAQTRGSKQVTIKAEHRLQWRLLEADRERIDAADRHLATFTEVSLGDYIRRPTATPAK